MTKAFDFNGEFSCSQSSFDIQYYIRPSLLEDGSSSILYLPICDEVPTKYKTKESIRKCYLTIVKSKPKAKETFI